MTLAPRIVSIVEDTGDARAVPKLVERVWAAMEPSTYVDCYQTITTDRDTFARSGNPSERERALTLARDRAGPGGAIFVLLDSDGEPPCRHGARPCLFGQDLEAELVRIVPDVPFAMVFAVRMFESWFLAAASSLAGARGLPHDLTPPDVPEAETNPKAWLSQKMRTSGLKYNPARDQVAFISRLNLDQARAASPSFDRCYREIERLIRAVNQP